MSTHHQPVHVTAQATSIGKDEKAPWFMIPLFKLPNLLYRLHLGWVLGKRFMQLVHVGRRSGKIRRTVLAVLRFDPQTREILAVSAWKGSDWYYNIQAAPALRVETGRVHYVPDQRTLSPEEITAAFMEYRQRHPYFSRLICRIPAGNGTQLMTNSMSWHAPCAVSPFDLCSF